MSCRNNRIARKVCIVLAGIVVVYISIFIYENADDTLNKLPKLESVWDDEEEEDLMEEEEQADEEENGEEEEEFSSVQESDELTCVEESVTYFISEKIISRKAASRIRISLDKPSKCPKILTDEINLNKKVIEQYPLEAATPYLKGLGLYPFADLAGSRREVPVIVTAASHTHFSESLKMVNYVREVLFKEHGVMQIVYFDIGLTFLQRIRMRSACQCDFREFPFEVFPDHVRTIYGFAWKPIAIQLALQDYGSIMWMDSSVRFVRSLEQVFKSAYKQGIQVTLSFAPNTTVSNTDLQTFKTLGEEPCSFRNTMETYATWMILHSTPFIAEYVMKPWVSCALIPNCMVVDRVPWSCDIDKSTYGACHRFDQSVLSIILNRLYFNKLESMFYEADVWKKCGAADSKWYFPDIVNNYIYATTSLCI